MSPADIWLPSARKPYRFPGDNGDRHRAILALLADGLLAMWRSENGMLWVEACVPAIVGMPCSLPSPGVDIDSVHYRLGAVRGAVEV